MLNEPLNSAAAYFVAGISGWLRGEVIRFFMNDHGSSNNILKGKSFVIKDAEGVALIAKQGRHISGVIGVVCISGIIV